MKNKDIKLITKRLPVDLNKYSSSHKGSITAMHQLYSIIQRFGKNDKPIL